MVDAHPAHHRRDGSVGFGLHPRGTMFGPRCGRPGNNTQPDAAPAHSGSDGMVSEGGCSMISAGGW